MARREVFDDMSIDEFRKSSREYMDSHPLPPETVVRIEAFKAQNDRD